jgi:hypothetical protein
VAWTIPYPKAAQRSLPKLRRAFTRRRQSGAAVAALDSDALASAATPHEARSPRREAPGRATARRQLLAKVRRPTRTGRLTRSRHAPYSSCPTHDRREVTHARATHNASMVLALFFRTARNGAERRFHGDLDRNDERYKDLSQRAYSS